MLKAERERWRTLSGRRASSSKPVMWRTVRTTVVSSAKTETLVAAMPPLMVEWASKLQPSMGIRSHIERTSSMSAPASMSAPRAMSPAMPEKQWNQTMWADWSFVMVGSQKKRSGWLEKSSWQKRNYRRERNYRQKQNG